VSGWQINAEGVAGVIGVVDGEVELLDTDSAADKLSGVLGGLSWGGEYTAAVADAVTVGVGSQVARINAVKSQVVAGRLGAVGATNAYQAANVDMATQIQAQAAASATSGDFTWFENGGH
jgi:Family of unknown function (DUF6507)